MRNFHAIFYGTLLAAGFEYFAGSVLAGLFACRSQYFNSFAEVFIARVELSAWLIGAPVNCDFRRLPK
jgi:hypothetical protein